MEWIAYGSNAFNAIVPFYADVEETSEYLNNTTGRVSTENFYWSSRLIAAMADASYNKSLFHVERYQERVAAKGHELINRYDARLAAEQDTAARKVLRQQANTEIAAMLQKETDDTLDKVLFELSQPDEKRIFQIGCIKKRAVRRVFLSCSGRDKIQRSTGCRQLWKPVRQVRSLSGWRLAGYS